jgi:hypothetical protein
VIAVRQEPGVLQGARQRRLREMRDVSVRAQRSWSTAEADPFHHLARPPKARHNLMFGVSTRMTPPG